MSESRVQRRERERREEALLARREDARRSRREETPVSLREEARRSRREEGRRPRREETPVSSREEEQFASFEEARRPRREEAQGAPREEGRRLRREEEQFAQYEEAWSAPARERKRDRGLDRDSENDRKREREADRRPDRARENDRNRKRKADRDLEYDRKLARDPDPDYDRENGRKRERNPNRDRDHDLELARKNERKRRRRTAGGVIALIIILLVAFTGFRIWMESRPGGIEPIVMAAAADFEDTGRVNILFLGENQGLTDTIIVFSYDIDNKQLDAVSVPRDTYYYRSSYPGAAYQKVNSVYKTEGYEGACQAVSDILGGTPIHYYAVLGPEGVKKIVDAVGGVTMTVPIDMVYSDPDQNLYIDLRAGTQLLNGDQAMQYLRFRSGYANADLGRVSAQQEFLKAVLSQSAGLDYPKLALTASSVTKTNMSMTSGIGLVSRAASMSGGSFNTYTIPGTAGMQDGASYFFHDAAGTKELMRGIYGS